MTMTTTALIIVQRQHGPRAGVLYAAILELGGVVERSCRAWCEILGWSRATFMRAKRQLARAGIIRSAGAELLRVEAVSPLTPPVSPVTPARAPCRRCA